MRILVIEDDRTTGDYIANGLREEGHVVDLSRNGREGLPIENGGAKLVHGGGGIVLLRAA